MGALPLFLVGFVFALAAYLTLRFPPKKINQIYGYRTKRSMSSQENWDIAQKFSSQLMLKQGLIMLAIACILVVLPIHEIVSVIISVALLIGSVIVLFVQTEKRLK
jgi:uncharacterized membrane protein